MEQIIKTLDTHDMKIDNDQDFDKLRELTLFQEKLIELNEQYHKMKKHLGGSKKVVDMNEYMRNYYHTKEKYKVRDNYICEACGCTVKYHSKAAHISSKKHIRNIENPEKDN